MIKTISFSSLDKKYLSDRQKKQGNNTEKADFTKLIVNNPEKNGFLYATIGPGLYRVRDKNDKKYTKNYT